MPLAIPSHETGSFQDLAGFFTLKVEELDLFYLNPMYQGNLLDIPKEADSTNLTDLNEYVFHITILQHAPKLARLIFVFCKNGSVIEGRIPESDSGTLEALQTHPDWKEGILRIFEIAVLTLERTASRAQRASGNIRNFLRAAEDEDRSSATQQGKE